MLVATAEDVIGAEVNIIETEFCRNLACSPMRRNGDPYSRCSIGVRLGISSLRAVLEDTAAPGVRENTCRSYSIGYLSALSAPITVILPMRSIRACSEC